jgi:8-amino-7-oxononanoate synthase
MTWSDWVREHSDAIRASGQWRTIRDLSTGSPSTLVAGGGEPVISFASNDYLGLSQHPALIAAARESLDRYGTGSGASRLVVGSRPVHHELEVAIAEWKGTQAAILFPSGYMANVGVLTAFGRRPGAMIISDALNHASIIDGARLARAPVEVFPHGDLDYAVELLSEQDKAIVVSDSVFSMDGDVAAVDELAELTAAQGALLVIDEAHAVLGPRSPVADHVVIVGTMSKTLGSVGGYVAGTTAQIDLLRNTARSFIFTTAPAPPDSAAALAAVQLMRGAEGEALRARLRANVDRLRPGHPSPIVPVIVGSEDDAVRAADALLSRGLLVPAIRPPTVEPGTSRLRIALSAAHSDEQIDELASALHELGLLPS